METEKKAVISSDLFELLDLPSIYKYGQHTFGVALADAFFWDIIDRVRLLETEYMMHPECRYLPTKNKIYRNIILGSYLIIYRITPTNIEILRAFHGGHSPELIKSAKNIVL